MSDQELVDKFLDCLDWADIPAGAGRQVAERVLALEEEESLADVLAPADHGPRLRRGHTIYPAASPGRPPLTPRLE
jgi:hypothetical protein